MSETIDPPLNISRLAKLVEDLRAQNAQLEEALSSRIVIEQAKGVLAERYRLDMDRAFQILRGAARASRSRLRDLAAEVVEGRRTPTAIEFELMRGRSVRGPFPATGDDRVH
jgi:AmiR/NasT family two-component response regulator